MRTTKESRSGLPHHGEPEVDVIEIDGDHWDCWPDERDQQAQATMMLRALSSAEELAAWGTDQPSLRKGSAVPRSLWDVLTFDGDRYREEGWSTTAERIADLATVGPGLSGKDPCRARCC